jgi:hypothetical protein
MREDLRLLGGGGVGLLYSEKLLWVDKGGSGERDLDVERELWPEREGRLMWMVRESRRDGRPWLAQEVGAPEAGFRVSGGASGRRIVEVAGLDETALDETEDAIGLSLSQGAAACLRRDPGLSEELEAA